MAANELVHGTGRIGFVRQEKKGFIRLLSSWMAEGPYELPLLDWQADWSFVTAGLLADQG